MIKKRHVFYLSGFDPRGPSYYHALYQTESQSQVHSSDISFTVGKRTSPSKRVSRWEITAKSEDNEIITQYDFLRWDDIIRKYWTRNEGSLLAKTLASFWLSVHTGLLAKAWRAAWKPTALFIYPTAFLTLTIVLSLAGGWIAHQQLRETSHGWLPAAGAIAFFLVILAAGRILSAKTSAYWLLRLCNFCIAYGQGHLPCVEKRLTEFATLIAAEIRKTDADEYLIVGHSVGAILAVPVMARLLESRPDLLEKKIAFLTLGQCIPLVSFLPHAENYRHDLKKVGNSNTVIWVDFTSPADPACFALVDPVAAAGLSDPDYTNTHPKLLNARFYKILSAKRYKSMRLDGKRLHFQYLMAGDVAGEYDYFAITAGNLSLAERFGSTPSLQSVY